jgi:type II secretory pathway pseudopilin PulG
VSVLKVSLSLSFSSLSSLLVFSRLFNGIQGRANDVAIKNDLNVFAKKALVYATLNGKYPTSDSELLQLELKPSRGSYLTSTNNYVYCVRNADTPSSAKVAVGSISKSTKPFYWYNLGGEIGKPYTGSITNPDGSLREMQDICADVMGEVPDSFARGYLAASGWASWANR